MVRTQIQLTEELARKVKELARQRNISMAEATRRALEQWIQAEGDVSLDERRRRAIAAVGGFHSGKSDVSRRHDEYLAEAYLE